MIRKLTLLLLVLIQLSTQLNSTQITEILNAHNVERAKVCSPNLSWNPTIAQVAQAYSDKCVFNHNQNVSAEYLAAGGVCPSTDPKWTYCTYILGENIASNSKNNLTAMVNQWNDEKSQWTCGTYGYNSNAGHYTQNVWQFTLQVGCGLTSCPGIGNFLVCDYFPPGNFNSNSVYAVDPANCTGCKTSTTGTTSSTTSSSTSSTSKSSTSSATSTSSTSKTSSSSSSSSSSTRTTSTTQQTTSSTGQSSSTSGSGSSTIKTSSSSQSGTSQSSTQATSQSSTQGTGTTKTTATSQSSGGSSSSVGTSGGSSTRTSTTATSQSSGGSSGSSTSSNSGGSSNSGSSTLSTVSSGNNTNTTFECYYNATDKTYNCTSSDSSVLIFNICILSLLLFF